MSRHRRHNDNASKEGGSIKNYGVWAVHPVKLDLSFLSSKNPHVHLLFNADEGNNLQADINVKSQDAHDSRLIYWYSKNFTHPITSQLTSLTNRSFNPISGTDSDAVQGLDFLRMRNPDLLPGYIAGGTLLDQDDNESDIVKMLEDIFNRVDGTDSTVYVFGQAYYDDGDSSSPNGIHDIHMNQGSLPRFDNGVSTDGALIFQFEDHFEAVFLAFASQRAPTDARGLASASSGDSQELEWYIENGQNPSASSGGTSSSASASKNDDN